MPHQDGGPGAGGDLRPTWDLYRRMADSPNVRPARRDAVLWALGELERRMGPDWLERYWEAAGHVPAEVNLGSGHVAAFGNLLDLALRFHVLDGVPGSGRSSVTCETISGTSGGITRLCSLKSPRWASARASPQPSKPGPLGGAARAM